MSRQKEVYWRQLSVSYHFEIVLYLTFLFLDYLIDL